jgi:hypothetical protein
MAAVASPASTSLRALWSPVNAQGHSFLWFIRTRPDEAERGDLLTFILHDELGIVYASAYPELDLNALPMPAPRGATHRVRMVDGHHTVLLAELDPQLGLSLLDEALTQHREARRPWPGEIVVFGTWLWAGRPLRQEPAAWPSLPAPASGLDEAAALALLDHPAFSGWLWLLPDFEALMADQDDNAIRKEGPLHRQVVAMLLDDPNRAALSRRLQQQARWLKLAREPRTAAQALAVREAVEAGREEDPFLRELAWRSLITAAADRAMRRTMRLLS